MNVKIHHYVICFNPMYSIYFHQLKLFQTEEDPLFFISSHQTEKIIPQGEFIKRLSSHEVVHQYKDEIHLYGVEDQRVIYGIKKINHEWYEIVMLKGLKHIEDIEYVLSLRIFSHLVAAHNHMILHASAINFQEQGILFSGVSKVGKTTLAKRIMTHHEDTTFINDDKPLITHEHDTFFVHGTPWAGEEGLCRNQAIKLSYIFFLEQGLTSEIKEMTNYEKVVHLIEHSYHLFTDTYIDAYVKMINQLIDTVSIYKMIVSHDEKAYDVFHQWMTELKI